MGHSDWIVSWLISKDWAYNDILWQARRKPHKVCRAGQRKYQHLARRNTAVYEMVLPIELRYIISDSYILNKPYVVSFCIPLHLLLLKSNCRISGSDWSAARCGDLWGSLCPWNKMIPTRVPIVCSFSRYGVFQQWNHRRTNLIFDNHIHFWICIYIYIIDMYVSVCIYIHRYTHTYMYIYILWNWLIWWIQERLDLSLAMLEWLGGPWWSMGFPY